MGKGTAFADELSALGVVLGALEGLEEDKREFVIRTAIDRLGITTAAAAAIGRRSAQGGGMAGPGGGGSVTSGDLARMTPKEFMRHKQPVTDVQRIACLAYFLTHGRGTAQFKTADLTKLNTEAAGARFSNAAVAVRNATGLSGFLAPAGGGKKQITALGEDVVAALPDQERARMIVAGAKKPRRRKKSKKAVVRKA